MKKFVFFRDKLERSKTVKRYGFEIFIDYGYGINAYFIDISFHSKGWRFGVFHNIRV